MRLSLRKWVIKTLFSINISRIKTNLFDWKPLRALYTLYSSNDCSIVKETRIGQSAAKHPVKDEGSTTIETACSETGEGSRVELTKN